jgi:uncharacterized protein
MAESSAIRQATADDFAAIVELNLESERFLSPLDGERLRRLHQQAAYHRVIEVEGRVGAFLLAFRAGAAYDSPNYCWFVAHYPRFLYIDRIVVRGAFQGRGYGARLYHDVIAFGAEAGESVLTCEFDLEPPNPASRRFHQRFGFREVGTQWINQGRKQVSLQARPLDIENREGR